MKSTVFTKKYSGLVRRRKKCGVNRFTPRFYQNNYLIYFRQFMGNIWQFLKKKTRGKSVQREANRFSAVNRFKPHWFIYQFLHPVEKVSRVQFRGIRRIKLVFKDTFSYHCGLNQEKTHQRAKRRIFKQNTNAKKSSHICHGHLLDLHGHNL